MNKSWPLVPLGEVLHLSIDAVPVDASASYPIAGVYSFGRGLLARNPVLGTETTYKVFHRLHKDDFVLSQLKAWEGALARVPVTFDGWFLSPQFPTFHAIPDRIAIAYLDWYCKQSKVWEELRGRARGMGARRDSVSPEQFLALKIPLPPLPEQQRIVARIEELAVKIQEVRGLRRKTVEEAEALTKATMRQCFQSNGTCPEVPLQSVCAEIIDNLHSNPVYAAEGVPCVRSPDVGWGRLHLDRALRTSEEEYIRRTVRGKPRIADIVLVREGGGTGKAAIVEDGQRFSLGQRVMMLRPNKDLIMPKFFLYQILSPTIYEEQILPLSKGSASPHLNIGALRKFILVLPSLLEQSRIVAYLDDLQVKVDALKRLQAGTATELDALLPSVLDKAFKGEL